MRESTPSFTMRILDIILVHLLALRGVDTILASTNRQVRALRVRQAAQVKKADALFAASRELGFKANSASTDAAKAARVAAKLEELVS